MRGKGEGKWEEGGGEGKQSRDKKKLEYIVNLFFLFKKKKKLHGLEGKTLRVCRVQ